MTNGETLTLSVEEAGKALGLGRNAAYAAANADPPQLPVIRIGGRILVSKIALQRMLEEAGNRPAGSK